VGVLQNLNSGDRHSLAKCQAATNTAT
jgi:hypothetical protein